MLVKSDPSTVLWIVVETYLSNFKEIFVYICNEQNLSVAAVTTALNRVLHCWW
jgi:hypothetical protein